MNIIKKDWYCYQCTLQFESSHIFSLHLKLVHKQIIQTKSIKNEPKSIEFLKSKSKMIIKSDSNEQIVSVDHEKKTFKCKICNYKTSNKANFNSHFASIHKEGKRFDCNFCLNLFMKKRSLSNVIFVTTLFL